MITLTEGNLRITLPHDDATARKFDDISHGLSHCMKAVDFVVELGDRVLFIEIKDPGHPRARPEAREVFIKKFLAAERDEDLVRKFRDSFLYEWACGRFDKPIRYWVIVAIETLTEPDLLHRTDELKRELPVLEAAPTGWARSFADDCRVFNIRSWNEALPAGYRVSRVEQ